MDGGPGRFAGSTEPRLISFLILIDRELRNRVECNCCSIYCESGESVWVYFMDSLLLTARF
mgnify:CR=1 FL=1